MRVLLDEKKDGFSPAAGTEGGRRPSGVPAAGAARVGPSSPPPDPEVPEKPVRRKFSAEYKLRILEEADKLEGTGGIGALLRREGLYSSHLATWRRNRTEGTLGALSPKKRGPKPEKNPLADQVARLERENERLKKKLAQAETIIDVQKKVSGLLGMTPESPEPEEESS